jgi:hypothetical protein
MGTALGVAVVLAVAWLLTIALRPLFRADHAARLRERVRELDAAREGGRADHPIAVQSPAQIEPRFEREPCPRCGGSMHVRSHEVDARSGELLRRVVGQCGQCGETVTTWFALLVARPD